MSIGRSDVPNLLEWVRGGAPDKDRPLILFLPGLSGNNRQWDVVLTTLADERVDVAYGPPVLPHRALNGALPTVTELSTAIAGELAANGRTKVVIVSHSVGAFVALGIANAEPDLVSRLILVNGGLTSVARFIDNPAREIVQHPTSCLAYLRLFVLVSAPMPAKVKRAIASRQWASRLVVGGLVSTSVLESEERRSSLLEEAGKSDVVRALWHNRHHWAEFESYARNISTPVEFIMGSRDPMTTEKDTRFMADLVQNATVDTVVGAGHAVPLENPEIVVDAIVRALSGLDDEP